MTTWPRQSTTARTTASTAEQSSAGLDALDAAEFARLAELNATYRRKFGYPFIIAVRHHTKQTIFGELERRIANDAETELENALQGAIRVKGWKLVVGRTERKTWPAFSVQ